VRKGDVPVVQGQRQAAGMRHRIVFLPGLLCDAALWAPQVEALQDEAEIFIPNLARDDSMQAMAQRVLGEVPFERFALAGLSMGGYAALEIMRQAAQRIERLALLDTRARPDSPDESERRRTLIRIAQGAKALAPVNKRMLPLLVHAARLGDQALVHIIQGMAERTGLEGYMRQQEAIMSRADFRPTLAAVACPTLVLCGRQDAITGLMFHEEMAAGIKGSKLVVLADCGHLSTLEKPDEVNVALKAWLEAPG
jgi:pimeloyl-ACP methyl ester carboxylesterase